MEVYSVKVDSNTFQWIMPDCKEEDILRYTTYDCEAKQAANFNINWYAFNPKSKLGNFFTLGTGGAFAFDQHVYDSDLLGLLEMAGEIIPIQMGEHTLYILNVLECVNALDEDHTKWDYYDDGSRGRILEYAFHKRFSESSLFKIPQTCKGEILTYSGLKDNDDEFKSLYEKLNFTGLLFDKVF